VAIIEFKAYSFKYESLSSPTLKNLNFKIEQGEKVLIAGPSGSGKSTIAHCINGLIPCSYKGAIDGTLRIKDFEPAKMDLYKISEHVGTILQDQDCQFVGLSVGEDVAFSYENDCKSVDYMKNRVSEALEAVGMIEHINKTPHNLSGGQKQLVSLAGILAIDADILLFDEPLANLDPVSRHRTMALIDQIHGETGKTIIVVEHRIEDVLAYDFDRMIVVDNGTIVGNGKPDLLLAGSYLTEYGLREPLYVELLKKIRDRWSIEDGLANITNTSKYRELIKEWYEREKYVEEKIEETGEMTLALRDICFSYYKDESDLIKNVSFEVKKGEILAVLGNNGAGKSTLLKLITGLKKQRAGNIELNGKKIDKWSIKKRSDKIGYVMQNPNHMITQNMVFDEVALGLKVRGVNESDIKEKVESTLKVCGLYGYRNWPVEALSYGQKKRVTIASILAIEPDIILLDEPTAGQDYYNYREFMEFLMKIKETGISMIMITHDLHLTLEYADRALVLSAGEVLKIGSIYDVLSDDELMSRANLRETTLSEMAKIAKIDEIDRFLETSMRYMKGGRGV
jgi:energy-coupling factor transport system ATP-binding protein